MLFCAAINSMKLPINIILSRNDGVGDMVLMLPMAGIIKQYYPAIKVAVLGKQYTKALVDACVHVDQFIDEDDFFSKTILIDGKTPEAIINVRTNKKVARRAKALKIPLRIGTTNRIYHWLTCNKLVSFSRKKSTLHEAQLNIKLLQPLGISKEFSLKELEGYFGLTKVESLETEYGSLLKKEKFNVIIHAKSQGSSREWPISHFTTLINILDADKYNIFLSGVEKEKEYVQQIIDGLNKPVINLAGKINLGQFISLIKNCDGIIANATGPIHAGAALGTNALGLYPPIQPMHPGRWAPLGPKVQVFVLKKNCNDCQHTKHFCPCINAIEPASLKASLDKLAAEKTPA
jgi:heptosyltransferase III